MTPRRCLICHTTAHPEQRFCGHCGTALDWPSPIGAVDDAERRQLTIIFCDIVGSTALTDTLGAERFRELLRDYRERAARCFHKYDGYIARYFGDGTLVYFGYPRAHEDDAWRAVQASLELQWSLRELESSSHLRHGVDLRVRVAVHTGTVVVGDIRSETASENMAVIGNAPNIASRLQEFGEPGTVTISEDTYRLVRDAFTCRHLGEVPLRGLGRSATIYRVEGAARRHAGWARRLQAAPLVGRARPLDALGAAWDRARQGEGGIVLLTGEAGVGKSRLIGELASRIPPACGRRIVWRCSPLFENTALYPFISYMTASLGLTTLLAMNERVRRLERAFRGHPAGDDTVRLLAPLLGIDLSPERYKPLGLSPQQQRDRLQQRLAEWLRHAAQARPVLLVIEDLHWADPTTLDLLARSAASVREAPVLAVLSARGPLRSGWVERVAPSEVALGRLDRDEARRLIRLVARGQALPEATVDALGERADGVPLFIEEITRGVIEAGEVAQPELAIPATLQESLAGRIDRASVDRAVLQLSATLGREFSFDVLAAAYGADRRGLRGELDKLVAAGLLEAAESGAAVHYTFRHTLIQDAIYQFPLTGQRQANHERVALALIRHFPALCERSPELVARHYLASRDTAAALPYLQSAAATAIQRSANVEASNYLRQALGVVGQLPPGRDRVRAELGLLSSLGVVLSAQHGFAAEEAGAAFARARELCKQLGRVVGLFPVLHGLYRFYFVRVELTTAGSLAREMLSIAREQADPALLLEAHRAAGNCRFLGGQFAKATRHFDRTMALYSADLHGSHRFEYGTDPFVVAASMGALSAFMAGRREVAFELMAAAVDAADALDHPYSLCWALALGSVMHQIDGDLDRVVAYSERQLAAARRHGFTFWEQAPLTLLGWCAAVRDGDAAGIARMRDGIDAWRRLGAVAYLPYHLSLLADAYLRNGAPELAEPALDEALRVAESNGELWWLAELNRLRGRTAQASAGLNRSPTAAEGWFRQALDTARRQRARPLIRRAEAELG